MRHGERERKWAHEFWECCFNSSLCFAAFIPFISFLSFFFLLSTISSSIQPPEESHILFSFLSPTLPPFHFGFLASCLYPSPVFRLCIFIISPDLPNRISSDVSDVCVSFILSWWCVCLSVGHTRPYHANKCHLHCSSHFFSPWMNEWRRELVLKFWFFFCSILVEQSRALHWYKTIPLFPSVEWACSKVYSTYGCLCFYWIWPKRLQHSSLLRS